MFPWNDELLSSTLAALVLFDKSPFIHGIWNIDFHYSRGVVAGVEYNLRYETQSTSCQSEIKLRCEGFIHAFIVFKHVFYHVVRFMDRVPLWVLIGMLDFYLQRLRLLCLLSHSEEVVLQNMHHVPQLFVFVTKLLLQTLIK